MGCDIHAYAEYIRNGKWVKAGKRFENDMYLPQYDWSEFYIDEPYCERNYNLFAILAGVRNERGPYGEERRVFWPISVPRDLPEDVTAGVKRLSDRYGIDGHSHSFLYLRELMAFDWQQKATLCGFVDLEEYKRFKWGRAPQTYAGDVGGAVVKVSNEEMDKLLENPPKESHYYTQVFWETTYYKETEHFHRRCIPRLQALGKPEDVRIVFWFDN